jgi:hypothetical protein
MGVVVEVVKLERPHTQTDFPVEAVEGVHEPPQLEGREEQELLVKEITEVLQLPFRLQGEPIGDHQVEVEQEPLVLIKLEQRQELEALDFLVQ